MHEIFYIYTHIYLSYLIVKVINKLDDLFIELIFK